MLNQANLLPLILSLIALLLLTNLTRPLENKINYNKNAFVLFTMAKPSLGFTGNKHQQIPYSCFSPHFL